MARRVYKNENPDIMAIDASIFSALAEIKTDVFNNKGKNKVYGITEQLRIIKRKCESGSLKLVILPSVFDEILPKLTEEESEFLRTCLVLEPSKDSMYLNKVYELASSYCEAGIMHGEKDKPSLSAIVMAEASVAGLNLLTNDNREYLSFDKAEMKAREDKKDKSPRATAIANYNKQAGLVFKTKNNEKFVPRPYSTSQFMAWFKNTGAFGMCENYPDVMLLEG